MNVDIVVFISVGSNAFLESSVLRNSEMLVSYVFELETQD